MFFFSIFQLNADNATEVNGGSGEPHETDEEPGEDDLHFEPIVSLPLIEVSNNEEDEVEMIKLYLHLISVVFNFQFIVSIVK